MTSTATDELDGLDLVHVEVPGVRRPVPVERQSSLEASLGPLLAELVERLDPRAPEAA